MIPPTNQLPTKAPPIRYHDAAPPKDLQALGGPAPLEYVDAAGGVMDQGQYIVSGVRMVAVAT